jgi:hypothetical protein
MDKGNTPLLLPLLAFMAMILPFAVNLQPFKADTSSRQSERSTFREEHVMKGESELPAHSAAKLVSDYFYVQPDAPEWTADDPRKGYSLEVIVATVPDPIDSRLPYFFDCFLDSIQRASEAAEYVLDSFDLAWTVPSTKDESENTRHSARFETDPSLLLFRNPSGHKLLLVFLVGETPTGGVHKLAMDSALEQIAGFYSWGPGHNRLPRPLLQLTLDSRDSIKLMAPAFSGSAQSLKFVLRNWQEKMAKVLGKPPLGFRIVSGSATAINPQEFAALSEEGKSSFQAVVPPDSDVLLAVRAYLKEFGISKIALLSEANTAYGRNKALINSTHSPNRDALPDILNLPFPLHISELRYATNKQQQSTKQQSTSELPVNTPSALPLPEGTNFAAKETPPPFSALELSSAELVLASLLSTIAREEIHAVGIMATDAQDTIFLTQEIRSHSPSTVVFTLTSDLIFTHAQANPSTEGLLVMAPYPLFTLNQVWSAPFAGAQVRVQFPNEASEGVYNATLALLDRRDQMLEYGLPFVRGSDQKVRHPALWVTAVGRHGPLPVSMLKWDDPAKYSVDAAATGVQQRGQRRHPPTARGVYTVASTFGVGVAGLLLIALSVLVIRQYLPAGIIARPGRLDWFGRLLGDPVSTHYCAQSRLYLLAACVSLLNFYLLLVAAFLLPKIAACRLGIALDSPYGMTLSLIILAVGLVTQCIAIALLTRAFWKSPHKEAGLSREVKGMVSAGFAVSLAAVLYLDGYWFHTAWLGSPYSSNAIFIHVRAFSVESGLSPLVPLFAVAMAAFAWACSMFRRLRVIDGMRPAHAREIAHRTCPFLGFDTASFEGVSGLERQTWNLLEDSSVMSTGWYLGLLGAALLAGIYFFHFRLVRSFEGEPFYLLFGASFFLVYWALAVEFVRLVMLWFNLSRLLRRLSWHPMRAAFGRYRERFPGLGRIDFATPPPTFTVLSFSLDQAERLLRSAAHLKTSTKLSPGSRRELEELVDAGAPEVYCAGQGLFAALRADAERDWRLATRKRSESQCALARFTPQVAKLLEPVWRSTEKGLVMVEGVPTELRSLFDLAEEFLAGRAVHFVSFVLPSLRNLGLFVLTGLLLMLGAVISYPFQPRNQILLFEWIIMLAFVATAWLILVQMDRDAVLSALSGTTPGQVTVTRQFLLRIFTYVLIPVLALFSAQFPTLVGQIVSLLGIGQGHP